MEEAQKKYKDHFDSRLRRVRKLEPNSKVYLNVHDGLAKPGKLVHEVAGPFRVLKVDNTNTAVIQRGDVVERVSMDRLVRAPANAVVVGEEDAHELSATAKDLAEKNTDGESYAFKSILDHRERDDGSLEFKIDWVGNYDPSWQPRANIPEEAISRYLARRRIADTRAARSRS